MGVQGRRKRRLGNIFQRDWDDDPQERHGRYSALLLPFLVFLLLLRLRFLPPLRPRAGRPSRGAVAPHALPLANPGDGRRLCPPVPPTAKVVPRFGRRRQAMAHPVQRRQRSTQRAHCQGAVPLIQVHFQLIFSRIFMLWLLLLLLIKLLLYRWVYTASITALVAEVVVVVVVVAAAATIVDADSLDVVVVIAVSAILFAGFQIDPVVVALIANKAVD